MTKKKTKKLSKPKTRAINATGSVTWDCPSILGEDGRGEWDRMLGRLLFTGRLDNIEPTALLTYCRAFETWTRAEAWINDNGLVAITRNDKGEVKGVAAVPHVAISARAASQMRQFLTDCGLTPASSAKIETVNQEESIGDKRNRLITAILSKPNA